MTNIERSQISRELTTFVMDTADEWLRRGNFLSTPEDHEGTYLRIEWRSDTGSSMVATLTDEYGRETHGRYRVTVSVEPLDTSSEMH